jgi:hypothetical protein
MRHAFPGGVAVALTSFFHVATTNAQPARDPALAEQLFKSAQACLDANDWQCACPKFAASMESDPAASTQINVAKCLEHDGKLTLAWAALQDALKLNSTIAYADESRRAKLAEYTQKLLDALEHRVAKLRIVVAGHPDGLQVRRNGNAVPLAALGEPIRVDPGAHELVVEAPGFAAQRVTIKLAEGQLQDVTLTLTPARPDLPASQAATSAPPPAPAPPELAAPTSAHDGRRIAGWTLVGVGAAGVAAAGLLGIVTLAKTSTAQSSTGCMNPSTEPAVVMCNGLRDAARGFQTAGVDAVVAGGIVGAAGVVLLATAPRVAPSGKSSTTMAAPVWSLGLHPTGVTLVARY